MEDNDTNYQDDNYDKVKCFDTINQIKVEAFPVYLGSFEF